MYRVVIFGSEASGSLVFNHGESTHTQGYRAYLAFQDAYQALTSQGYNLVQKLGRDVYKMERGGSTRILSLTSL